MKQTVLSQRAAVYAAILGVFEILGVEFEPKVTVAEDFLTDDMRDSVSQILCEGFKAKTITLEDTPSNREKLATDSKLKVYVSGLISNWLRKDPELNGGKKYEPKNPGSRAGSGDEMLKTLKASMKKFGNDPVKAKAIQAHIDARVAQITADKTKEVTLTAEQIEKLDPELRKTLGI